MQINIEENIIDIKNKLKFNNRLEINELELFRNFLESTKSS